MLKLNSADYRLRFKLNAATVRIGIGICKGKEALAHLHLVHAPLQEHFISSQQALDTSGNVVIHLGTHLPSSSNHENCPGDGTVGRGWSLTVQMPAWPENQATDMLEKGILQIITVTVL